MAAVSREPSRDAGWKRQRSQNACDTCRRKKIKCDSATAEGGRCSNCVAYDYQCTHAETPKKRGPKSAYTEGLEHRMKKLDALFRQLHPEMELDDLVGPWPIPGAPPAWNDSSPSPEAPKALTPSRPKQSTPAARANDEKECDNLEDVTGLSERLEKMDIGALKGRFFGPTSNYSIANDAFDAQGDGVSKRDIQETTRAWKIQPWEEESKISYDPQYSFPDTDLLEDLLRLYFKRWNALWPILHEPTFRQQISDGLHMHDRLFGGIVLFVCALASKESSDPRVVLERYENAPLSAGWEWFSQVKLILFGMVHAGEELPSLQLCFLGACYLAGTTSARTGWMWLGLGLRCCQDLGAHRRRPELSDRNSYQHEQLKRAFWCIITLDRYMTSVFGRTPPFRDTDFDIEFPAECDDEYWMDPISPMQQPPGTKPSLLCFFNHQLSLTGIMALALRLNKDARISDKEVSELGEKLQRWFNDIPEHLKWDPGMLDEIFFIQSTCLHVAYYYLQIQIHHPSSKHSVANLAICANAARSCSQVLAAYHARGQSPTLHCVVSSFLAGIALTITVSGLSQESKRTLRTKNDTNEKDTLCIYYCLEMLEASQTKWIYAARLGDLLRSLMTAKGIPLRRNQPGNPMVSGKRRREEQDDIRGEDISRSGPKRQNSYFENFSHEHVANTSFPSMYGPYYQPTQQTYPVAVAPSLPDSISAPQYQQEDFNAYQHADFASAQPYVQQNTRTDTSGWSDLEQERMSHMWTGMPPTLSTDDWGAYLYSSQSYPQWR